MALVLADQQRTGAVLGITAVFAVADVLPEPLPRWATAVTGAAIFAMAVDAAGDLPSGLLGGAVALLVGATLARLRTNVGPVMAALAVLGSALGVYLTVPDTEEILAVGAVLVPLTVIVLVLDRTAVRGTAFSLAGLLAWAAAQGGRGRPGAVVGALGCLVLLAVLALVARRAGSAGPRQPLVSARALALLGVQAAAVLACSRWAGLETTASAAAVIAVPVIALAAGAQWVLARPRIPPLIP